MAANLVSLIMQFLTPEAIARIASALGLDRTILQKAVVAAIPALLGYLANAVAKPGGEKQLGTALARQPAGALDTLMNILGGTGQKALSDQKAFVDNGSSLLSGLLGGGTQELIRSVGQYAGLGEGASKSLMGMLGPVVLDALGQQQRKEGIDIGGLANLLTSQRQQFAAALPSGFDSPELLQSLDATARTPTAAADRTARTATAAVDRTTRAAAGAATSASRNWLYWVIPALAILALLYYLFKPAERVVQQSAPPPAQSLVVGGVDLGRQVTDGIANLRTALGGITDVSSAQAALPRLQEITAQFDRVSSQSGQLSAEQRRVLSGMVNPLVATLNQLFDKVLAIPGVSAVLKPVIDNLKARIAALAA
jgi:hypothetical protein